MTFDEAMDLAKRTGVSVRPDHYGRGWVTRWEGKAFVDVSPIARLKTTLPFVATQRDREATTWEVVRKGGRQQGETPMEDKGELGGAVAQDRAGEEGR